ncbi:hypothetical protein [Acidihalobacter prosperus]|nr:hypothetical protein [Acidihalobacter prosperus]
MTHAADMPLDLAPLEAVCALIESAPGSAGSLVFYGLIKGMAPELEMRGNPVALSRLRMLDAEQRRLAYALMELHAQGANRSAEWAACVARLDRAVAAG